MEQFPDLASEMPEIPDEFDDRAGIIVPNPNEPIDPIDQYVRPPFSDPIRKATVPDPTNGLDLNKH